MTSPALIELITTLTESLTGDKRFIVAVPSEAVIALSSPDV